ncbi:MAG: beta-ketoacyl-ACP reductase [Ignavibacteriales bacterium CG_4_9_14_3_um_filter_30_11]|nr:MAG: beta-ketoacyl-ACP reductase [Ignavibacteriales bacterium CG_4_9_14_3_um_filter_30_11]
MENKTVIVTGGTQGIGKAISNKLLEENYFVVIADITDTDEKLVKNTLFVKCDISKEEEIQNLYSMIISKRKKIDAVVNNAGIIRDNVIWKMPKEDMDKVIDINLKGTWMMCKEAAKIMKEQKYGRIVNISSRAWLGNNAGQSNYTASKAGIVGLTRVLALELGKYNVNVNAIAPGLIDTPLTQNLSENVLKDLINAQPTKKMGKPIDIANAVSFLLSEKSDFITGQIIHIDGGKSIGSTIF